jgi:hypothetical protein
LFIDLLDIDRFKDDINILWDLLSRAHLAAVPVGFVEQYRNGRNNRLSGDQIEIETRSNSKISTVASENRFRMSNFDHRRLCRQSVINRTLLHLNDAQAREFIRKKLFNSNHESFEGFMNAFRTKIQSLRKLFYHFHITKTGSVLTEPTYFQPIFMLLLKEIITAANLTTHSLELGSTFPLYKNVHVQMRDEDPVMKVRLSGECDILVYEDDFAADSINCLVELKYPTHSLYRKYANKEKCQVISFFF